MAQLREPMNGLLHFSAFLLSLVGLGPLLLPALADGAKLTTLAIYGVCMCLAFLASSVHHIVRDTFEREILFLRLDHAAIYLFIAGTYTPIAYHLLPDPGRWWLLAIVWLMAVAGIVYKLCFYPTPTDVSAPPDRLSTLIYVLMGWLVVFQLGPLMQTVSPAGLTLALVGGLLYTLGGVILTTKAFDFIPGRFGHHEIWHVFVMAGALCFYLLIYREVLPA